MTQDVVEKKWKFRSAGLDIEVVARHTKTDGKIELVFTRTSKAVQNDAEQLVLHWGGSTGGMDYVRPHMEMLPEGTKYRDGKQSVRTDFVKKHKISAAKEKVNGVQSPDLVHASSNGSNGVAVAGGEEVCLTFREEVAPETILFLVYIDKRFGCKEQWFKPVDGATSFVMPIGDAVSQEERARRVEVVRKKKEAEEKARLEKERKEAEEKAERERKVAEAKAKRKERRESCEQFVAKYEKSADMEVPEKLVYEYENGDVIAFAVRPSGLSDEEKCTKPADAFVVTNMAVAGAPLRLHWGLKVDGRRGWVEPAKECWPEKTETRDGKAVQSEFKEVKDGVLVVHVKNIPSNVSGFLAVLHIPPHTWMNKPGGGDMFLTLRDVVSLPGLGKDVSAKAAQLAEDLVEKEMEYGSWTLMHRYGHGQHVMNSICGDDTDCWSTLYVWMRYSQLRVLDWQRNYNTQPRQLSAAQMGFVTNLAQKFKEKGKQRWNIRMTMSCVGRGGGGDLGQRIRDDILVILRHNRGWGHGSMMEQWHQKLHNNTTPDDVVICNALLAFWHSHGNRDEYWRVLYDNGVTRERLASYSQPITSEPDYPGHIRDTMLHELGVYGNLLKTVHLGTDLDTIVGHCRWFMNDRTRGCVEKYMHERWHAMFVDKLRSALEARKAVMAQLHHVNNEQARDLLFLDIAIENDARLKVEGGETHDGSLWAHVASVAAAAQALALSEEELESATRLNNVARELGEVLKKLEYYGESEDAGLRAAAAMNMARNTLTQVVDRFKRYVGSMSTALGTAFHADKELVDTFVEESIRGGPAYSLSALLRKAEPAVRRVAQLGPWTVIAPRDAAATGKVRVYSHLRKCMAERFERDTIIVAGVCDGDEDVPANAAFVIIGATVDILSHVAVRARNEHHALIACFDESEMDRLRSYDGSIATAKLEGDALVVSVEQMSSFTRLKSMESSGSAIKKMKSRSLVTPPSGLQTPPSSLAGELRSSRSKTDLAGEAEAVPKMKRTGSILLEEHVAAPWAIQPSAYTVALVGSKSLNLGRLMSLGLPDWIHLPTSVTIPNGALKKAFRDEKNAALRESYSELRTQIYTAAPTDVKLCPKLRDVIRELELPDGLAAALRGTLDQLGCDDIDAVLPGAWDAVKGVWASTWNERAHLARRKCGMYSEDVDMAVLCQQIIDADYAFVIHTTNPITGSRDEIYGEIVVGLGETLVSNAPGQALGFVVSKKDLENPSVKSYPSKQYSLHGGLFIFRSDSNSEDLEGFAGAGLHDSIPLEPNRSVELDYSKEPLMLDDDLRKRLMVGVGKIGKSIEELMGGFPQDIEGCYKDGKFYVVQARPQV